MTDYFRGKTLTCEQTKPRTYFTPIFQRIGDGLKLHHMEVDCLSYQHSKKMLPIEHMGKHKRRIFELEAENAKLRELVAEMYGYASHREMELCNACTMADGEFADCAACGEYDGACGIAKKRFEELYADRLRELGVEVDD